MRVCRLCHAALTQPPVKSPSSTSPSGPVASLLQVSANASSVISGYLMLKTQPSKPWMRRWFALHVDFVLYTFKSESENMALTATPMPGFIVTEGTELPEEDPLSPKDRSKALKMHHSRKSYYLQASSNEDKDKYVLLFRTFIHICVHFIKCICCVEFFQIFSNFFKMFLKGCKTFRWFHALQLATKAELPSFATIENEDAQKSQLIVQ